MLKKVIALILVMTLAFSTAIGVSAESKGNPKSTKANNGVTETQKVFKAELNEQKKAAIAEKAVLNKEKGELETEYEGLLAAGDTAGAEAKLAEINELNAKIEECQAKIKEANDERYMIVKTLYTEEELAAFENAGAAIDAMYKDAAAYILEAGCIMVNENVIKFDTPAYIKGGVTLVPIRAITEELGADVAWDDASQTVSITKDGIVITMTIGSNIVTVSKVSDVPEEETTTADEIVAADESAATDTPEETQTIIDVPAEITNWRTYVPLRFLAETLELAVTWDGENETIDVDEQSENEAETDTTGSTNVA